MTPEQSGVESFDPNYGWERAIPEPFWVRSWRTLFRYRPACYECGITFPNRDSWGSHFLRRH